MIFAEINWLSISIDLLLVVFVIVCLLMALLILMQRPKQEGLGAAFGGGVTDQVFGARTTNVLQRGTVYLGSMFFILSLVLAILFGKQTKQKSLLDEKAPAAEEVSGISGAEEAPAEVPAEQPKSLEDELPAEDAAPTPEETAPAPEGGAAPAPEGGAAPAPEGGAAPAPTDGATPAPEEVPEAPIADAAPSIEAPEPADEPAPAEVPADKPE
jgi:preprotein translocase subunit SecG